jgi:hypothetical protein
MHFLRRLWRFAADEWDRFSGRRAERQAREFAEAAAKFRREMTRGIADLPSTEDSPVENGHNH